MYTRLVHHIGIAASVLLAAVSVTVLGADLVAGESTTHTIEYRVDHNVAVDGEDPTLNFQAPMAMSDVEVVLNRSGEVHQTEQLGDLRRGQSVQIVIDQSTGRHHYQASIRGTGDDGTEYDFGLEFQVRVTPALEVELLRDGVDLDAGLIPVQVNRPVDRIELQVADGDGRPTVRETRSGNDRQGRFDVEWDGGGDVGEARVTVYDVDGNWTTYTLEPFWVEIPQQQINFETGTAEIEDDEASKLAATRDQVMELLERHDDRRANIRLYVAGYTDTVGAAAHNLELSQERAQSIARWFRDHGVDIPIYYQGFGQEVLAVETPDETEEERNRRAVYILGNTPPTTSEQLPRADWRRLR